MDHVLTHGGRVTHISISKLTTISSDNGLSPGRRQAIIWTNAGILLTGTLRKNFSEILIEIHISSFKKTHLKMLSAKFRPSCLGLNVLRYDMSGIHVHLNETSNWIEPTMVQHIWIHRGIPPTMPGALFESGLFLPYTYSQGWWLNIKSSSLVILPG